MELNTARQELPKNKTILITGSSRGIGAATAKLLSSNGYSVCINYNTNESAAYELLGEITACHGQAIVVQADISKEKDVIRLFEETERSFGYIDGLVNNAGIISLQSTLEHMDFERIQRIFSINTIGAMICAREAVKRMQTKNGGRGGVIVNVSTALAKSGAPNLYLDYAASKGAIETFTIGLARETADQGIRVNVIRPGMIDTEIHLSSGDPNRVQKAATYAPMKRVGQAIEVAKAISWLISDESSYTTGAVVDVSGGV